jgi:hypothetical protein
LRVSSWKETVLVVLSTKKFRSDVCRRFIVDAGAADALAIGAFDEALTLQPVVTNLWALSFDTMRDKIELCSYPFVCVDVVVVMSFSFLLGC